MDLIKVFSQPNPAILAMDLTLSIDDQKKYFQYYMSRHLFDVDYHLVLQKFFPNASSKLAMEKGFDGTMNPHHLLAMQAYIPTQHFKDLFQITTDYQFPSIQCDGNGIMTGNTTHNYALFENFKLVKLDENRIGVRFYPTDSTKIRDTDIEMFIMQNQINHIQLNLTSKDVQADFASTQCMVYPEIIRHCPAVYDTLYITDYFLKYIYYIFVQIMIYEKSSFETKQKTFLIGIKQVDGLYKVSNLEGHAGFLKLLNTMQLFILKNKLKGNIELKESYARYGESGNQLNIYINYDKITYSAVKFDDNNLYVELQTLKADVNMGYKKDGRFEELPLFAKYIIQFCNEHYQDIKKAFPIFERLENIYRLCAMSGIINYLKTHEDLEDFTIDQMPKTVEECVLIDTYASSIMCFGGLVLTPRNFVKVPFRTNNSKSVGAPVDTNRLLVIRRGLANAPVKVGSIAHSGILQIYNGKTYILEYGPNGVSQKEIQVPNIEQLEEFEVNGEKWSKQMIGNNIPQEYEPDALKKIMEKLTNARGEYNLINNNCHMAQESVRKALGLTVENPYK